MPEGDKKEINFFKNSGPTWLDYAYSSENTLASERIAQTLKILHFYSPRSILDIGCGDGRFLNQIRGNIKKVGIDFSESMLKQAKKGDKGIDLFSVDLESSVSKEFFQNNGPFEFVTLLGVVHYLDSPQESINRIKFATNEQSVWVISFRNRLFNLGSGSKYSDSAFFKSEKTFLEKECKFWENNSNFNLNNPTIDLSETAAYPDLPNHSIEGVTDSHWNPDGFTNWRQFTPAEGIRLLQTCQLKPLNLVVIGNDHLRDKKEAYNLNKATSFLLVAKG
jgi:SAM-dependent methyltransferase